ncbi:MAG: hypothetical protein ABI539_13165 [Acidobacteriota bacterium]
MTEDNYLAQIETAYSRCRERRSMLSPIDWQLAQSWQDCGIPIHIVLRAISDCCKRFKADKRPDRINTLRYFEQAVKKEFSDWQASQIGKNENGSEPGSSHGEGNAADRVIKRCEDIILKFGEAKKTADTDLRDALTAVNDAVFQIILQVEGNGDTSNAEERLAAAAGSFDPVLVESAGPDEIDAFAAVIARDFGRHSYSDEIAEKLILKHLYSNRDLPRLTFYEL